MGLGSLGAERVDDAFSGTGPVGTLQTSPGELGRRLAAPGLSAASKPLCIGHVWSLCSEWERKRPRPRS